MRFAHGCLHPMRFAEASVHQSSSGSVRWVTPPNVAGRSNNRIERGRCLPVFRGASGRSQSRPKQWIAALRATSWTPGLAAQSLRRGSGHGHQPRYSAASVEGCPVQSPGQRCGSDCAADDACGKDPRLREVLEPMWWEAPCNLLVVPKPTVAHRRPPALSLLSSVPPACTSPSIIPMSPLGERLGSSSPRDSEYGIASWQLSPAPLAAVQILLTPCGSEQCPSPRDSEYGLSDQQMQICLAGTQASSQAYIEDYVTGDVQDAS